MTSFKDHEDRTLRFFFAAMPNAAAGQQLAAAAASLTLDPAAHRVLRSDFHVTLAFVGELPSWQMPRLLEIGRAQRAAQFTLRFDAYEYWPKPEVVVSAARTIPPELELLWQRLHGGLAAHRWALNPKRLRPHATLAKNVSRAPALQAMSPCDCPVTEFSLLYSTPGVSRSAYTVVDTWPLLDEASGMGENSVF